MLWDSSQKVLYKENQSFMICLTAVLDAEIQTDMFIEEEMLVDIHTRHRGSDLPLVICIQMYIQ